MKRIPSVVPLSNRTQCLADQQNFCKARKRATAKCRQSTHTHTRRKETFWGSTSVGSLGTNDDMEKNQI